MWLAWHIGNRERTLYHYEVDRQIKGEEQTSNVTATSTVAKIQCGRARDGDRSNSLPPLHQQSKNQTMEPKTFSPETGQAWSAQYGKNDAYPIFWKHSWKLYRATTEKELFRLLYPGKCWSWDAYRQEPHLYSEFAPVKPLSLKGQGQCMWGSQVGRVKFIVIIRQGRQLSKLCTQYELVLQKFSSNWKITDRINDIKGNRSL